jgi:hypothetical protein
MKGWAAALVERDLGKLQANPPANMNETIRIGDMFTNVLGLSIYALNNGGEPLMRWVLEHGADPTRPCTYRSHNSFVQYPLDLVAININLDTSSDYERRRRQYARILLEYGADPRGTQIGEAWKQHRACCRALVWCFKQLGHPDAAFEMLQRYKELDWEQWVDDEQNTKRIKLGQCPD